MERVLDYKGRWRNKTVAFRVSEEEAKLLDDLVALSGLTKQEYIMRRLLNREVVVQGNPRVYYVPYPVSEPFPSVPLEIDVHILM